MYLEKRKVGRSVKYYLVHSYREKGRVRQLRKYVGIDLNGKKLSEAVSRTRQEFGKALEEINTTVFLFTLTKRQLERLNQQGELSAVRHLDRADWRKFTEDFVYNTNAIEGSKVERRAVPEILEAPLKENADSDELETAGVARALEYVRKTREKDISLSLIKELHRLCFSGSKPFAGEIRRSEVVITNAKKGIVHRGAPAKDVPGLLEEIVSWYEKNQTKFRPLVLAAIVHNQFEHIHPFADGNGRVGRLLLNFVLLKNSYPPINITLEDRAEYYSVLEAYSKDQDIRPSVTFLIKQYKKGLIGGRKRRREIEN